MEKISKIMLLGLALIVSSCNQKNDAQSESKEMVKQVEVAKPSVVVDETLSEKTEKPEDKKPKKKLNLSIPEGSLNTQGGEVKEEAKLLPDMFEKAEKRASVGGSVLRDEENENYVDSIQGAQLNIKIATD